MDLEAGEAEAVQLTPCGPEEPDWSPDGSTILFAGGSIFSVPAAGGDITQLSGSSGVDWLPQYSPDGTEIVFRREPFPDRQTQIWKMTAAGELVGPPAVPLATEGEWHDQPAWSPDGEQIYFVSVDPRPGGFGIYVMDADIGEPATCVTEHEEGWEHYSEPAPSPDGRTLAFLSNATIILLDLRTGTYSAVLTDPPLAAYPFVNLEYSPDGRRLMFVSGHDIYVADLPGM
jgi:Tol biopolymer transport system component